MRTYLIDLDSLSSHSFRELIGFLLRVGYNFRKIDKINIERVSQVLVVEAVTKYEKTALKEVLVKLGALNPIELGNANRAILNGKKLGEFTSISESGELSHYYLDKSTGKKFAVL